MFLSSFFKYFEAYCYTYLNFYALSQNISTNIKRSISILYPYVAALIVKNEIFNENFKSNDISMNIQKKSIIGHIIMNRKRFCCRQHGIILTQRIIREIEF